MIDTVAFGIRGVLVPRGNIAQESPQAHPDVVAIIGELARRYRIVLLNDATALGDVPVARLVPHVTQVYPWAGCDPAVRAEAFRRDATLFVVADVFDSYWLVEHRFRTILFTSVFRLRREMALQRVI